MFLDRLDSVQTAQLKTHEHHYLNLDLSNSRPDRFSFFFQIQRPV